MFSLSKVADSESGVAEIKGIAMSGDKFQVSVQNVTTGTGTATITVKPGSDDEYQSIVDGTITMSAPIALVIEGSVNAVKCTSTNSGDVYRLEVQS